MKNCCTRLTFDAVEICLVISKEKARNEGREEDDDASQLKITSDNPLHDDVSGVGRLRRGTSGEAELGQLIPSQLDRRINFAARLLGALGLNYRAAGRSARGTGSGVTWCGCHRLYLLCDDVDGNNCVTMLQKTQDPPAVSLEVDSLPKIFGGRAFCAESLTDTGCLAGL